MIRGGASEAPGSPGVFCSYPADGQSFLRLCRPLGVACVGRRRESGDEAGRVLHDRSAFGNGRPFLRPAERYYAKKCGWNWNYGLLMEAVIQGRMDDIYRRGLTWEYFSSLDERDRYYDWMQRGRPACERASHPLNKWLDGI